LETHLLQKTILISKYLNLLIRNTEKKDSKKKRERIFSVTEKKENESCERTLCSEVTTINNENVKSCFKSDNDSNYDSFIFKAPITHDNIISSNYSEDDSFELEVEYSQSKLSTNFNNRKLIEVQNKLLSLKSTLDNCPIYFNFTDCISIFRKKCD
jgi:hypothetical protein